AEKAGIKKGDVIVKVDDKPIYGFADLNAAIITKRPNDVVRVGINRDGDFMTLPVKLSKNEINSINYSGLELEDLTKAEKKQLKINYGVRVKDITDENFMPYYDELKGGIILSVGNVKATDIETVSRTLGKLRQGDRVRIEMITRSGELVRFYL
ncbi:MAG TPA: PDZ domain-containing protein, partial [Flavobacterium sp.]|nr:PDZ domain-containing protein [Flavobacterium sp.]